tara:strand:- start:1514 stop:1762 length:249 start_codon:yes stop_codon:yes gene_type:complete
MTRFEIKHEVTNGVINEWRLCFQYGTYHYGNGGNENGYRFIWRKPDNKLQPARGQARIQNASELFNLISLASKEDWFIKCEI